MVCRQTLVNKRNQDNLDTKAGWAKANFAQTGQYLLRLALFDSLDFTPFKTGVVLPKGYNIRYLDPISSFGVVFLDKAHQDCYTAKGGPTATKFNLHGTKNMSMIHMANFVWLPLPTTPSINSKYKNAMASPRSRLCMMEQ